MATTTRIEPEPSGTTDGRARRSLSLREAFDEFARWPSPRIIAGLLVAAIAARVAVGGWTRVDLLLVVGMLLAHPIVEWVAHVVLLHMRPVVLGPVTLDPLFARKHREHHADPRELELVFIPTPVVLQLLGAAVVVALFAFPRPGLGLTFLTTLASIGIVYEWIHYLVHTDHRPRSSLYRRIWTHHRLHHFKNEHYWFSITSSYPDRVLGTSPRPSEVDTSPTVRDLLGRSA